VGPRRPRSAAESDAVAVNTSAEPQLVPAAGAVVLETQEGALAGGKLAPHAGAIARRRE